VLIAGCGSAFGDVTMWGYIEKFPSIFVGSFSAGSGICGLSSSLIFLILKSLKVPNYVIFFCFIPISFAYLANFLIMDKVA